MPPAPLEMNGERRDISAGETEGLGWHFEVPWYQSFRDC